jgi:mannose-6-phosphate isomerase-like protein (cupin superfamily)
MKYHLFDICGEIIKSDETAIVRENNELNNIWINSVLLFREKSTKSRNFLDQDSVYLFVDGRGVFEMGSEVIHVSSNEIILVPQNTYHRVINTGDTHLRYLIFKERL